VRKLAASLDRFGFVLPILIDPERRVVAGWGLVLAARQLGLSEVPAVSLTDLPEAELRVLRLALNRITDDAAWDREALALEFSELLEFTPQIDLEIRFRDGRDRRSARRPRPRAGRRIAPDRR
jgi:ParB-like chromosome segregation protein Spo0J